MLSGTPQFESVLRDVVSALDLSLSVKQLSLLSGHYELFKRWNARVNLSSISGVEEIAYRHFGESLALSKVIDDGEGGIVDIGSGGGFPGGPVGVVHATRCVVLVESVGKKATFLKELARLVPNIEVWPGRLEGYRAEREVDWVTMRGVRLHEVWTDVERLAGNLALLLSVRQLDSMRNALRDGGKVSAIPWDTSKAVLSGEIRRST